MAFKIENRSRLLNNDSNRNNGIVEDKLPLPWANKSEGSYLYYDCTVGAALDSGIVIHNRLPTVDKSPDTLGSVAFDDPRLNQFTDKGVNLKCNDQYTDIVQRMGHARYWFRLWGQAVRIGYKVPIPSIKTIGGVPAIPYDKNPQWAYNRIAPGGNYSGMILWVAEWSLWYSIAKNPVNNYVPAADPSALVNASDLPNGESPILDFVRPPYSQPDDNSVQKVNQNQTPPPGIISDIGLQGKPSTR